MSKPRQNTSFEVYKKGVNVFRILLLGGHCLNSFPCEWDQKSNFNNLDLDSTEINSAGKCVDHNVNFVIKTLDT